jgi:hypothetical protein
MKARENESAVCMVDTIIRGLKADIKGAEHEIKYLQEECISMACKIKTWEETKKRIQEKDRAQK